jgi:hypothetical protein
MSISVRQAPIDCGKGTWSHQPATPVVATINIGILNGRSIHPEKSPSSEEKPVPNVFDGQLSVNIND